MTQLLNRLAMGACGALAVTVGVLMTVSEAQAMTFDRLTFTGVGRLENADGALNSVANVDFANLNTGSAIYGPTAGSAFGLEVTSTGQTLTPLIMQDIRDLVKVATNPTAAPTEERDRWERDFGPNSTFDWISGDDWTFRLTKFVLRRSNHNASASVGNTDIVGDISGYFRFDDGTELPLAPEGNAITSQASFVLSSGASYSGDLSAVPTPAILPGVMAIGGSVWRKRKSRRSQTA